MDRCVRFVRGRLLGRAAAAIALVSALGLGAAPVRAALTPATGSLTIQEGSSATEAKTVQVPAKPPTADIEIAIDTTGSMTPSIEQAKADATNLVTSVQASVS